MQACAHTNTNTLIIDGHTPAQKTGLLQILVKESRANLFSLPVFSTACIKARIMFFALSILMVGATTANEFLEACGEGNYDKGAFSA